MTEKRFVAVFQGILNHFRRRNEGLRVKVLQNLLNDNIKLFAQVEKLKEQLHGQEKNQRSTDEGKQPPSRGNDE